MPYFVQTLGTKPTSLCHMCGMERPTLLHSLWQCPKLQFFWQKITTYMNLVLRRHITPSPLLYLLSVTASDNGTQQASHMVQQVSPGTHLCLLIARHNIMRGWANTEVESLGEVKKELHHLFM